MRKPAERLAVELVTRGYGGVCAAAGSGMMGVLADATLALGGEVIGVIPEALLEKEVAHGGLTELRVVASMHERKAMMAELSEGFIALPGGLRHARRAFRGAHLGAARPASETLRTTQRQGCIYDRLLEFLDLTVEERFVKSPHRALVITSTSPAWICSSGSRLYRPPQVGKVDRSRSLVRVAFSGRAYP